MNRPTAFVLLAALSLAGCATTTHAQGVQTRREHRDSRRDVRDDRRDRSEIVAIADAWNRAVQSGNVAAEEQTDARLNAWLQRELREDNREVRENRREENRSQRSRRRTRRSVAQGDASHRELREERRDHRDDRRDTDRARQDRHQTRAIARQLQGLQGLFANKSATPAQYAEKRRLLGELVALARREVRQSQGEVREDRRERRQHRRRR